MAASQEDIQRWIKTAKENGDKFIISVNDTFDYEDYPVYCKDEQMLEDKRPEFDGVNMQRINEIINITNI